MTSTNRISAVLGCAALLAFTAGATSGAIVFLRQSHTPEHESAGTAAWPAHLALTVAAAALLTFAWLRARRSPESLGAYLSRPIRQHAARRLLTTAQRPLRVLPIALLTLLIGYNLWRAGEQVTAGLDPHFTANAWGGPNYLGAMYCHYLDVGLISALTLALIDRLLLDVNPPSPNPINDQQLIHP